MNPRSICLAAAMWAGLVTSASADLSTAATAFNSICLGGVDRLAQGSWNSARDRAHRDISRAGLAVINVFNDEWSNREELTGGVGAVSADRITVRRPYAYICLVGANASVSRRAHRAFFEQLVSDAGYEPAGRSKRMFGGGNVLDGNFRKGQTSYDIYVMRMDRSETVMFIGVLP